MRSLAALGFGLVLALTLAPGVSAQTSCSGWNATCLKRCKESGGKCTYCSQQMASCKQSGCWAEIARFGGAKHCNLKK